MQAYQRSAPRNRRGRIQYDDASLGLAPWEMRERFAVAE